MAERTIRIDEETFNFLRAYARSRDGKISKMADRLLRKALGMKAKKLEEAR